MSAFVTIWVCCQKQQCTYMNTEVRGNCKHTFSLVQKIDVRIKTQLSRITLQLFYIIAY